LTSSEEKLSQSGSLFVPDKLFMKLLPMSKTLKKIILFITDFVTINIAFFLWCKIRLTMGFFSEVSFPSTLYFSLIIFGFWFVLFSFYGLYKTWFTRSRIDEFITVVKTITIGVFLIFLITFDFEKDFSRPMPVSRLMIVSYWGVMIILVSLGRILLRTIYRRLLEAGIGRRRAVIVGWGKKAWELFDKIIEAPALGYEIVGFIKSGSPPKKEHYRKIPLLGSLDQLYKIIQKKGIQEVLIAFPRRSERHLREVITQCNGTPVGIKIVPDLYDVIVGQVRTNQIYGFPLIEILPQLMQPWEQIAKRIIDILVSVIILIGFSPLWLIIAGVIYIDSKGPIFYTQKRVGKNGKIFKIIKFRSMVVGAEKMTGPVWASAKDPRVTRVGKFLRRLRLDEVPQFFNVLIGDMSLVGPRPERPFFVEKLKKALPLYNRRLRVRPGITGWAQIKGEYDQSLEHVRQKLKYDLFYLENMSFRMDLKIILNTLYVMLRGKGR